MARTPTSGNRPKAPARRVATVRKAPLSRAVVQPAPKPAPKPKAKPAANAAASLPAGPYGRMNFCVVIDRAEIGLCHVSALHWIDGVNTDPDLRQTVTLRRAVGQDRTLYDWRRILSSGKDNPRQVTVILLAGPGGKPVGIWRLVNARPIRWTGPEFDAMSDGIAWEELEIAYERIDWLTKL
jgi:hypothetical protein